MTLLQLPPFSCYCLSHIYCSILLTTLVPKHPKFRNPTEKYYGEKLTLDMQETKKHLAITKTSFIFTVIVTAVVITTISITIIHNTSFVC
jgi:hypothetical protein